VHLLERVLRYSWKVSEGGGLPLTCSTSVSHCALIMVSVCSAWDMLAPGGRGSPGAWGDTEGGSHTLDSCDATARG
jgi:hypothetical protein